MLSGLLGNSVYGSVTEIAEAEKIDKSYVRRILRLALLAPDIVEAILGGWSNAISSKTSNGSGFASTKSTSARR
jgi:hypothetical protein